MFAHEKCCFPGNIAFSENNVATRVVAGGRFCKSEERRVKYSFHAISPGT